jgi:hypothetical protein
MNVPTTETRAPAKSRSVRQVSLPNKPPPSPSPSAVRARDRRARQRDGVEHDLRVRRPTRRLVAAMRAANPKLPERDLSRAELEAEVDAILGAFEERWLDKNKPHA